MTRSIRVDIVSAEGEIFSCSANLVCAPSVDGEIGIAPGHSPLIARLRAGDVRVQSEGQEERVIFISGGMVEVQPDVVTVLADTAERAEHIDLERAEAACRSAEIALAGAKGDFETARAQAELAEALARLKAVEDLR